jgi:hypothetical protein
MQQPQLAPYPISDFLQWQGMKQLELTPKFQRRDVWPAKAKSYLIDTILRKMPSQFLKCIAKSTQESFSMTYLWRRKISS